MTNTYLCPPNRDIGPNVQTPSSGSDHWAMVAENPNDGDTAYLRLNQIGREMFDVDYSAIPAGSVIVSVTVRVTQKGTTAQGNEYSAGPVIGGVNYFGPTYDLSGGTVYVTHDDVYLVSPQTGLAWTMDELGSTGLVHEQTTVPGVLPDPRLTQIVLLVDAIPPPDRPTAGGSGRVPTATGADPGKPTATASPVIPAATVGIVAGSAGGAIVGPSAGVAVVIGAASAAATVPKAHGSQYGKPSADAAPAVPTATAQALGRTATAQVLTIKGESS